MDKFIEPEFIEGSFRTVEDRVNFYKNCSTIYLTEDLISIFEELVLPYLLEKDIYSLIYILNKKPFLFQSVNVWKGKSISGLVKNHWDDLNHSGKQTLFLTFTSTDKDNEVALTLLQWSFMHYEDFNAPININSPIFHRFPKEVLDSEEYQNFVEKFKPEPYYTIKNSGEAFQIFTYAFLTNNHRTVDNELLDSLESLLGWDLYTNRQASSEAFGWLFKSAYKNYMTGSHFKNKVKLLLGFNEILNTYERQNVVDKIKASHPLYRDPYGDPSKIYQDLWYIKPSCFSPEMMDELSQKDDALRRLFYRHCYTNWYSFTEYQVSSLLEYGIHSVSTLTLFPSPHLPESLNLKAEYDWYEEFYTEEEREKLKDKIICYLSSFYNIKIDNDIAWSQILSILETNIIELFPLESQKETINVSI